MNSPLAQTEHKSKSPAVKGKPKQPGTGLNGAHATQKRTPNLNYQPQRSPKGSPTLYIMAIGACILLGGSYVMYLSTARQGTWYTAPANDGMFESTPVAIKSPTTPPVRPAPAKAAPTRAEIAEQPTRPHVVIDVPRVGLRSVPDIHMKASPASLKRGERVEVLKKISGKGPTWIKVRTKAGKVGWVIASVVTQKTRG